MITASIVTYKTNKDELKRVLNCSLDSGINKVYVVDNSPSDALQSVIESLDPSRVDYIFGQGNVGFGSGNNIAIRKAIESRSDYHIILNPDIIFDKASIDGLLQYMLEHNDTGLIVPKLTYPDGRFQAAAMLLPTPIDIFGRRLLPQKIVSIINGRYELRNYNLDVPRDVPNVCGCFMLARTSVLKIIGGFDESFFMYFEDFDLVRRIHQRSKVIYFPQVTIIHAHAAEHRKNKVLLKAGIKSAIQYFNKWGWLFDRERKIVNKYALSDESIINL